VTVLLRFVAAYCLFDAMNVVFSSAVKGAGDTRFVMLTSLALAPLPVAATWWALDAMQWGLIAAWWAITGWVVALGVAFLARFLQGHWRRMRVIEPALAD
jgi:MATE family multidrug resistance protein